jgi:DNA-binding response OmpR family regulator
MAEQTLLIVDDENGVIDAIHQTLEASGYRVLATTDPHRALAMLRAGEAVDLMIIDLFMPAMDGGTLLRSAAGFAPICAHCCRAGSLPARNYGAGAGAARWWSPNRGATTSLETQCREPLAGGVRRR